MQLTKTFFPNSAIFLEKKRVENWLWAKSDFLWANIFIHGCMITYWDVIKSTHIFVVKPPKTEKSFSQG